MDYRVPVKLLLVGAGIRGEVWAQVCSDAPGVDLVGIVDRDLSKAEAVRSIHHIKNALIGEDLEHALRVTQSDAVIVATPPNTHYNLVSIALSAGNHVLCEKPLSDQMSEVIDLVLQARNDGLELLVGMNFRYLSTSQRIKQYVEKQELGSLSHAHFSYVRHRDGRRDDLNDYPLEMLYPMLFEQSIHHFDLLRYCYGAEVHSLVADSWKPTWSTYNNDCCVSVLFRFEDNVHVNYFGTWTGSWNKMEFRWRSEFSRGVLIQQSQFDDLIRIDFQPEMGLSGSRFKEEGESEPSHAERMPGCVPFVDDSRMLLDELVRAIQKEQIPTTTAADHLRSLCLVPACIESLEKKSWVNLQEYYEKLGVSQASGVSD